MTHDGTSDDAVCPGCQFAKWHPHCTSIRADHGYGERVDLARLEREGQLLVRAGTLDGEGMVVVVRSFEELISLGVGECDYVDLSVSCVDGEDEPSEWCCPECGGTDFDGRTDDYRKSGPLPGSFDVSAEE